MTLRSDPSALLAYGVYLAIAVGIWSWGRWIAQRPQARRNALETIQRRWVIVFFCAAALFNGEVNGLEQPNLWMLTPVYWGLWLGMFLPGLGLLLGAYPVPAAEASGGRRPSSDPEI